MVRQGVEQQNSAAPDEPYEGVKSLFPLAADLGGLEGTRSSSEISSRGAASALQHADAAASRMLQTEFVQQQEDDIKYDGSSRLCHLLSQTAADGSLARMLLEINENEVQGQLESDMAHEGAADLLTQAVQNGSLKNILSEMKQEMTQQASVGIQGVTVLPQAASDGSQASASKRAEREDVSCALPGTVGNLLLQAMHDGRLESVLSEVKEEVRQDDRHFTKDASAKLFDIFGQAADDGSLESVLLEIKTNPVQGQLNSGRVHERFANLLVQAAQNGVNDPPQLTCDASQEMASKQVQTEHFSCGLPGKAGSLLLQAGHDGRLESVLSEVKEEEVRQDDRHLTKDASAKLFDIFGQAVDDGSSEIVLFDVLGQAAADGSVKRLLLENKKDQVQGQLDTNRTHESAANLLKRAVQDGSLESILLEMKQETTRQASHRLQEVNVLPQPAGDGSQATTSTRGDSEDVSCGLLEVVGTQLLQAVHDGRLESVLNELKEELRQDGKTSQEASAQRFHLLRSANDDGHLKNMLLEIENDDVQGQWGSDQTRTRAANLLLQAVQNGSLGCILSEIKQEQASRPACSGDACLEQVAACSMQGKLEHNAVAHLW
eukprot:TRINITY_DN2158_c0_g1_i2.p1 TRINITY_DN2158_c0_g1~~TRINITY_DN2158_c0_g1_i2.p1  ORF type:complete len:605 (+),score=161.78 TRINITY_DN2158_c0_g1_i2:947-2761(+)